MKRNKKTKIAKAQTRVCSHHTAIIIVISFGFCILSNKQYLACKKKAIQFTKATSTKQQNKKRKK